MTAGVPVITTKGAPWKILNVLKCGWWIDFGVEPLIQSLKEAMSMESLELEDMGLRTSLYCKQKYSWTGIGESMASVYGWIINKSPKPKC